VRWPSDHAVAAAIFIAALLIRIFFCFAVYPHVAGQFGAGDDYDLIARHLAQGDGYVLNGGNAAAERLPLYPLLLAAVMAVFGSAAWPWQTAQAVAGAFTCALLYRSARRVASQRGAVVAAGICVVHPTLILYTARPLTETLYVLLVFLFVDQIVRLGWRSRPAGLLLGLQLLTKSTAFLHVVTFLPALAQRRGAALLRTAGWVAVVLAPWALWNLTNFGVTNLTSATGGIALYHGTYISRHAGWTTPAGNLNFGAELALRADLANRGIAADADIRQRDAVAGQLARAWIRANPIEALRLWGRNLLLTWYLGRSRMSMAVYAVLHGALLIAAAVGARRLWHGTSAARWFVAVNVLLIVAYTVFHAAVQPAVRYILPVVPCAALLAAAAFRLERSTADERRGAKNLSPPHLSPAR
jgi:4-amino-4-deoxy-L-arabinose transferase-like glycosyltransferase